MPLYNFKCDGPCGEQVRRIFSPQEAVKHDGSLCGRPDCGGHFRRAPTGPTSQVLERIDDGVRPRTVELYSEATRLFKERARQEPKD